MRVLKAKYNYEEDLDDIFSLEEDESDFKYIKKYVDDDDDMSETETNAISSLLLGVAFLILHFLMPDNASQLLTKAFFVLSVLCIIRGVFCYVKAVQEEELEDEEE